MRLHPGHPVAVTGAAGKTGRAVIAALRAQGEAVRGFVRNDAQASAVREEGAQESVIGDLRDRVALERLLRDCGAIYHICPNMHPDEIAIGHALLDAMAEVRRTSKMSPHLVYHSVLRPQIEAMPHHWAKLRVEEKILAEVTPFTILQPAPYYQNILAQRSAILREGRYPIPYREETLLAMVDLADIAEVAAHLISEGEGADGVFELTAANWRQDSLVAALGRALGQSVEFQVTDRTAWARAARTRGMSEYAVETLLAMFQYYERSGLTGNATVLRSLLGRTPTSFEEFVAREFATP